jgi:hypothetical protein
MSRLTKPVFTSKRRAVENRHENRITAKRPVRLALGSGVTRNIAASGVFFETVGYYVAGTLITFAIELRGLGEENVLLACTGRIVRVENKANVVGVGVKIVASTLKPIDAMIDSANPVEIRTFE